MENNGTIAFKAGVIVALNKVEEWISENADIHYIEKEVDELKQAASRALYNSI